MPDKRPAVNINQLMTDLTSGTEVEGLTPALPREASAWQRFNTPGFNYSLPAGIWHSLGTRSSGVLLNLPVDGESTLRWAPAY